jgi:hypothetical protein
MALPQTDPEIGALQAVYTALKRLKPEARRKVLSSVSELLEIAPIPRGTLASVTAPDQSNLPRAVTVGTSRPPALIEVLQDKRPGTNAQRIAVFAYYREKYQALSRFARNDLRPYFAQARVAPPTNFDRDFVEAVKRGWIHEDAGESYLTSKGVETVEAGFPGERKYEAKSKRSNPKKKKGQRSARRPRRK